ncbi:lipoprotein N-acyltransferase Lnb domain-containing protein [Marinobacter gelidimuriae]|uniref:lipoprotein N-acyltransferase Lnb domain-containing protein n=1 Tax=Marinobacter gelidimuriae TaxID=2739064 RepID=UPI002265B8A4|nr:DUF4105 domain-containing protein [Marinobacter gelidimuriae]
MFAASYLNSPSSMFSHTFLRLAPPRGDEETNLLLADTFPTPRTLRPTMTNDCSLTAAFFLVTPTTGSYSWKN